MERADSIANMDSTRRNSVSAVGGKGISKNKQKILMESSNQAVFFVQGHFTL